MLKVEIGVVYVVGKDFLPISLEEGDFLCCVVDFVVLAVPDVGSGLFVVVALVSFDELEEPSWVTFRIYVLDDVVPSFSSSCLVL